jgi:type I restriction enzyme, S subunit
MPNLVKNKNIPTLRFPGFLGEWEGKRLEEVACFRRGSFPQPYGLPEWYDSKNGTPFVQVYDVDFNMRLKEATKQKISDVAKKYSVFVEKGSVVLTIQGSIGRIAMTQYDSYVDRTLLIFKSFIVPLDKVFFLHLMFLLFEIEKQKAPGGTIKTITKERLSKFKFYIPILSEQQKIAEFLGLADEWIFNLRAQKESLEKYKKGMMQEIFSQRIRFKDEGGEDFLKWEEKKLCETCKIKKGKQLNRAELSLRDKYPVINGGVNPSGFTDEWNMEGKTISISEGGNSCGYVNFIKSKFWCGGHCYALMLSENIELSFLYQLLKFLEKNIMRLRVGSGLPNIQKGDIERLKIQIASFPEQQKIAEFLTSIDNLVESKQQQITQAEKWKKGLMQGLFV